MFILNYELIFKQSNLLVLNGKNFRNTNNSGTNFMEECSKQLCWHSIQECQSLGCSLPDSAPC